MMKNVKIMTTFFLFILSFAAASLSWNVDCLTVCGSRNGEKYLEFPVPCGESFVTDYIHSVERTLVEDEYKIIDGAIWSWQERVKSSNAGMPSILPENSRFFDNGKQLVFQGGRTSFDVIYMRVGNSQLGHNHLIVQPLGKCALYEKIPGVRLALGVKTVPAALCAVHKHVLYETASK